MSFKEVAAQFSYKDKKIRNFKKLNLSRILSKIVAQE